MYACTCIIIQVSWRNTFIPSTFNVVVFFFNPFSLSLPPPCSLPLTLSPLPAARSAKKKKKQQKQQQPCVRRAPSPGDGRDSENGFQGEHTELAVPSMNGAVRFPFFAKSAVAIHTKNVVLRIKLCFCD